MPETWVNPKLVGWWK